MHNKNELAKQILDTETPRIAMAIGKQINVSNEWCKTSGCEIILKALSIKLKSCPEFGAMIRAHKDKKFAEATKHPIYGIGKTLSDKFKCDEAKWSGDNEMGKLLNKI